MLSFYKMVDGEDVSTTKKKFTQQTHQDSRVKLFHTNYDVSTYFTLLLYKIFITITIWRNSIPISEDRLFYWKKLE